MVSGWPYPSRGDKSAKETSPGADQRGRRPNDRRECHAKMLRNVWICLAALSVLLLGQMVAQEAAAVLAQTSLKQLTETTGYYNTDPAISADGSRVAFMWGRTGLSEPGIYVVNNDGTGLRLLGSGQSPPSISADGQLVVFVSGSPGSNGEAYVIRADGTGLRRLARKHDPWDQNERGETFVGVTDAVVSGNGRQVFFFGGRYVDGVAQGSGLFGVWTDSGSARLILSDVGFSAGSRVDWSVSTPSVDYYGLTVAFYLDRKLGRPAPEGSGTEWIRREVFLYAVNTGTGSLLELSEVSNLPGTEGPNCLGLRPAISGDGSRVAFLAVLNLNGGNPDGNCEVFTVKTDGTGLRQLTSATINGAWYPSITYDGERIAFVHLNPLLGGAQAREVYMVKADGSGLTKLTTTPPREGPSGDYGNGRFGAVLSADGSHLAFTSGGDPLGRNADGNIEIFLRRLTALVPVQGVINRKVPADLAANRHSLVARKDLVVRAFFDTGVGGASVPARGWLWIDEGTDRSTTLFVDSYTARPLGYFDDKPDARERLENSLNFFITGASRDTLLTPGIHTFRVRVSPWDTGGFTPWEQSFQATFRESESLDVYIIPVKIKDSSGTPVSPDLAVLPGSLDFLRSIYPVEKRLVRDIVLGPLVLEQAPGTSTLLDSELLLSLDDRLFAQLLWGNLASLGRVAAPFGPASNNLAVGILPQAVDGTNPIPGRSGYTYSSGTDSVVVLGESGWIGAVLAHEIGHQFGLGEEYAGGAVYSRNNPPPATPEDGDAWGNYVQETDGAVDIANRQAVFHRPGSSRRGFMGTGHERDQWATATEYAHLYGQLTTDTPTAQTASSVPTRYVSVSGTVTRTGGIQLAPFLVASSAYTFTRPSGTQYSFQFKDATGSVLDTVGFNVDFTREIAGVGYQTVDRAPFRFTVALPEGVSSMAVLTETTPMITYTVSARPPTVTVLAPNGGETLHQPAQVRWQASDPDGDALTYTVLYSPDGFDRYVVATGLTTTTYELDFGSLPPGDRASIIVRASDGFNYAEDASDAPFAGGRWRVFLPALVRGSGW